MIKEFKDIVGAQPYSTLLQVLKRIGPGARTHRICVVIAGMLRFALSELPADCDEGTLGHALITLDEEPHLAAEDSEECELVSDLIDKLCREAGLRNLRESARGESYSIAENVIAEYTAWYNMPWEDY